MSIQRIFISAYQADTYIKDFAANLYIADTTIVTAHSTDNESGFRLWRDGTWDYQYLDAWIPIPANSGRWISESLNPDLIQMRMMVVNGSDSTIECNMYQPRNTYNWQSPTWGAWFNIGTLTHVPVVTCYAHDVHTPPATYTEQVRIQVRTKEREYDDIVSDSTIVFARET